MKKIIDYNIFDEELETDVDDNSILSRLQKKYGLIFVGTKRYYSFDMTTKYFSLDNTSPFLFSSRYFDVRETSWNRMTLKILEQLDKMRPNPTSTYLNIKFWWNSNKAFSLTPHRYYLPFKNIYFNAGLSSTCCMKAIQQFLEMFNIPLSDCSFIIRRHYVSEPNGVRDYFRNETIRDFKSCLNFQGYSQKRIDSTIQNIAKMNSLLKKINTNYDDFFLFDDYYCFSNQKSKAIQKAKEIYHGNLENNLEIIKKMLSRLDDFYRNRLFYISVSRQESNYIIRGQLKTEISFLFNSLKTSVLTADKIYTRMKIFHNDTLEALKEFNTPYHLFLFAAALLRKEYTFQYPFVSTSEEMILENNDIILGFVYEQSEFSISLLNEYIDKMHLKRISNYLSFMNDISKDYVLVDCDKMIRKDCFEAEKQSLKILSDELKYYIKSFGKIDSKSYAGYSSLPEFEEKWNKYLLLGLVRTFYSDVFKITYNGNTYRSIDFVIDLL